MAAAAPLLALNLGSATLKAARFRLPAGGEEVRAERRIEIELRGGFDPDAALAEVVRALRLERPPAQVGHRIVHGGDATEARWLDAGEMERLRRLGRLAPLHQPQALELAHAAMRRWPQVLQAAVFDTAWHARLPPVAKRLAIPPAWDALGLRRYGFHGLAFASAMRLLGRAEPAAPTGRVVLAHLGGGVSLCAARDGRSQDTTMAATPLDGPPMATRSGSLDPGALLFLLRHGGLDVDSLEHALYRECGLRGLSGGDGDVRVLLASTSSRARLALDVFALRIAQAVTSMATTLGGLDALVFSGGIGARSAAVRSAIATHLHWLGVGLDPGANEAGATLLSVPGAPVGIWRIDVDEETEIAVACATLRP